MRHFPRSSDVAIRKIVRSRLSLNPKPDTYLGMPLLQEGGTYLLQNGLVTEPVCKTPARTFSASCSDGKRYEWFPDGLFVFGTDEFAIVDRLI